MVLDFPLWRLSSLADEEQADAAAGRRLHVSVRKPSTEVWIDGDLPMRWDELLDGFRHRVRGMAPPTRAEVTLHVWRQFCDLPMVRLTSDATDPQPEQMLRVLYAVERELRRSNAKRRRGR